MVLKSATDDQAKKKYTYHCWFIVEDEEDFEREALQKVLKRYSKLFHYFFHKYSNTGHKNRRLSENGNFEGLQSFSETIGQAELIKLLKDHDSLPQLISKDEVCNLMRIINVQLKNSQLTVMDFNSYQCFLMQLAFNVFK